MNASRVVVLGATGDLTGRYLLRALAELVDAGCLADDAEVVGVAREDWDDARFRAHAAERLATHAPGIDAGARDALVRRLRYVGGDVTDPATAAAALGGRAGPALAYLALPPAAFTGAVTALAAAGAADCRLVVEKPFGNDLASARALNALLHRHFPESSLFRIDHFLGKQTVQNVLGLRFANRLFEPLWCAEHVARVDVTWDETVALEGRSGYYDRSGALRDMVQNHLLQILAVVAMERPAGLGEGPLRDAKLDVLRAVRPLTRADVERRTVRARYTAGSVAGRPVPDYVAEPGVDPARGTETYTAVTLLVDGDRWRGVPFRLRTGKALGRARREIAVTFRDVDPLPFGQPEGPLPNVLTLAMDPDRMTLDISLNGRGDPFRLDPARWEVELAPQRLSAYARLLLDAIEGDVALAIRGDEAEASWAVVEPILAGWADGAAPLREYPAGSAGPR